MFQLPPPLLRFVTPRRAAVVSLLLAVVASPMAPAAQPEGTTREKLYGVTIFRELVTFYADDPATILSTTPITGLTDQENFESVRAIDFRPATEELYAVGNAPGGIYRLYKLNPATAVASQVGGNLQPVPGSLGFNFEPPIDRIRIVSDTEQNFRYDPDTGALAATDGMLVYASGDPGFGSNPNVVTLSYTNSSPGAATTTCYVIDTARDVLAQLAPSSGVLTTVGPLGIDVPSFVGPAFLEISPVTGTAYLTTNNPGSSTSHLYTVNLQTGALTSVGQIGETGTVVRSIAAPITIPPPPPPPEPRRLWVAGRDLAENERTNAPEELAPVNATVPEWSYGYRNTINSTDLTLFAEADHTNSFRARDTVQGWESQAIIVVNTGTEPVQFFAGNVPYKPYLPEQLLIRRTSTVFMPVVRWTAPGDGNYRILAKWLDLNPINNGGAAHVVVNGTQVFGRQQNGAFIGQEWVDEGNAMMPTKTLQLTAGSVVDFVLSTRSGDSNTDDTGFNAVIVEVPSVTLSAAATVVEGANVPVTVNVSHRYPIQRVELYVNGEKAPLPPDTAAPYAFVLPNVRPGSYYLTAVAKDDKDSESTSEQVLLTVAKTGSAARATGGSAGLEAIAAGRTFTCTQDGSWDNPATWGGQGVPGEIDDAIIPVGRQVDLTNSHRIDNLTVLGRLIGNPGVFLPALQVNGILVAGNRIGGPTSFTLSISPTGKFVSVVTSVFLENLTFINNGSTIIGQNGGIQGVGTVLFNHGQTRLFPARGSNQPVVALMKGLKFEGGRTTLGGFTQAILTDPVSGRGELVSENGSALVSENGSAIISRDGAGLIGADGASLIGADGASIISRDGAGLIGSNAGIISRDGAGRGTGSLDAAITGGAADITLEGGSVRGTLGFRGNVLNQGAFIMPGDSPGRIFIEGDYTQTAGGALVMEVGGTAPQQYDHLDITGTANLGGKLIVNAINGFTPPQGATFTPLTYAAVNGQFDSVTSNAQVTVTADGVDMQVSGPNPPAPKALNIATRLSVGTGDNVLIGGFIITGTQPKRVLLRGIGPSMNVGGVLQDPVLLLNGGAVVNDNWRTDQEAEIIDTDAAPTDDLEAAIVATLPPGPHTVIVRGHNNTTGVGLVQVFDLESGQAERLANISTRGFVQTGDDVMIGGFIIGGDYPADVIIRAVGPSLIDRGIANPLADPVLALHDSNGNLVVLNDDWQSTQEQDIIASTVAPDHPKEPAIRATLPPGPYTAIVRGQDGTTGVALVEAFTLSN